MKDNVIACCDGMRLAREDYTDSEGYGPAVWFHAGYFYVSSEVPYIRFCPWCGRDLVDFVKEFGS